MADGKETVNDLVAAHAAQKKEAPANAPKPNDPPAPSDPPKPNDTPPADPVKDLLKEFNLDTVDALREKLRPKEEPPAKSPEEKQREEDLYRTQMQTFAVENGLMKPDDFVQLENLKGKEDRSLVYERWLPSWREENQDVKPEEAEQRAREDFEAEYQLNSPNEKTKARGLSRIAGEAKAIRSPLETSFDKTKKEYDSDRAIQSDMPDFNKKVSGFIQENIPAKVKLWEVKDGEEMVQIEEELTDKDRKDIYQEVAKEMNTAGIYQLYKKGDLSQIQQIAKQKADTLIWNRNKEKALIKIKDTFHARGFKAGKSGGARSPFPLTPNKGAPAKKEFVSAEEEVMASLNGEK